MLNVVSYIFPEGFSYSFCVIGSLTELVHAGLVKNSVTETELRFLLDINKSVSPCY
jgi:hypothetical protein